MTELLRINNLTAGYAQVPVIKNINLELQKGDILGIVGESGSGKSTLIKAITQLKGMKTDIMSGEILYKNQSLLHMESSVQRSLLGKEISLIFQNPESSLNPTRKIRTQLYELLQAHGVLVKDNDASGAAADIEARIVYLFQRVGLHEVERVLDSYPFELSGGMAQRVAIVFALVLNPELILADEPTSALDTTVQKDVLDELLQIRKELGTSMLIITHNIGVVRKVADFVGVMYQGELVDYGPTQEILANPRHEYTKALLAAVPQLGGPIPECIEKEHYTWCR